MKSVYCGTGGALVIWKIRNLKSNGWMYVFGEAQCSEMGTVKWHILDHLFYNIYRLRSVHINEACRAEQSHRLI